MTAPATRGLLASEVPLHEAYDLALLDLDGVVYVGDHAVPGAAEAISAAQSRGMRCSYLTNNASRSASTIGDHLRALGVAASDVDVVTSAQVAASILADQLPSHAIVLVIGGAGLVESLSAVGLRPVRSMQDPQGPPQAVVQGFSPDLSWRDLAEAARAVRSGLPWMASNLDLTFPTPFGPAPGNGSLVRAVATAAGREPDQVAGKPDAAPFLEAVRRYGAMKPLVVGDRLDTDLEGAVNAGLDALAVLTGVSGPRELLMARAAERPTYLAADLSGLAQIHPAVTVDEATAQCRHSEVGAPNDVLQPLNLADPLDLLRAACALSWQIIDAGRSPAISEVLTTLDRAGLGASGAIA